MTKVIFTSVLLALLSGCASFGKQEYSCSGIPEGVRCKATRDIYEDSMGGNLELAKDSENKDNDGKVVTTASVSDPVIDTFVAPNLPDRPIPVRTPAKVMRIWVSAWEDTESGALIAPGYIYTEIQPRRWVIGKTESAASQSDRIFQPLK